MRIEGNIKGCHDKWWFETAGDADYLRTSNAAAVLARIVGYVPRFDRTWIFKTREDVEKVLEVAAAPVLDFRYFAGFLNALDIDQKYKELARKWADNGYIHEKEIREICSHLSPAEDKWLTENFGRFEDTLTLPEAKSARAASFTLFQSTGSQTFGVQDGPQNYCGGLDEKQREWLKDNTES